MNDPHDYTITLKRSEENGETVFKATVKELPHVLGIGKTSGEAYEMVMEAISGLQAIAKKKGTPFPAPAEETTSGWSGRVTLRLPKSLHQQAAELAEVEGVSFNQFLVTVITDAVARRSAVTISSAHAFEKAYATFSKVLHASWSKKPVITEGVIHLADFMGAKPELYEDKLMVNPTLKASWHAFPREKEC